MPGNGDNFPKCVLLFSGKRKSGKDYFTDKLLEKTDKSKVAIIKISAPIKSHFAKTYNLNLADLMSSSELKEKYREEMIIWSEKKRAEDPGVFCESAVSLYKADLKPVWIVSDVRRKMDIAWFKEKYGRVVKTVRISADEDVRSRRGWVFTVGVDDVESECGLDEFHDWDWVLTNNDTPSQCEELLSEILTHLNQVML